ncbi:hypothetical protein SLS60_009542 [Paraconiothyrium brasiliense]|uniref:Uncharacterized protein n=1 Tax=Paraconiothyrium brasiliense TaxID=300254 RepID=A0ABR3QUL8_9PLEO
MSDTFNVEDVVEYAKGRHNILDPTIDANDSPHDCTLLVVTGPDDTDPLEELKQKAMGAGHIVSRDAVKNRGQYFTQIAQWWRLLRLTTS